MSRAKSISAAVLALLSALASAQEQSLTFHYIAHSRTSDEGALLTCLAMAYPVHAEEAAIFYLANAERPVISCVNLPGAADENFSVILDELNTKSAHEVYPEVDIRTFIELFDRYDFLTPNGGKRFSRFTFNWWIDSSFWTFYSESVIARAYFVLGFDTLDPDYFQMQIFHAPGDELAYSASRPFGVKNLCGNYEFIPKVLL